MAIASPIKAASQAAIEGGEKAVAKLLDGSVEEVFVRVPMRKFQAYLDDGGDIPAIVELACNKPPGWADTLTDESAYELFEIARRVTDPRIASWIKVLNQEAEKLREKKRAASASPESPPGS